MTNAVSSTNSTLNTPATNAGLDDQLLKHNLDNDEPFEGVQAISEADFIARIASFERREHEDAQRARRMMRRWTSSTTTTSEVEFTQWQPPKMEQEDDQAFGQWIPPASYDQWIPPPSPVESTFSDSTDAEVDYFPDPTVDFDNGDEDAEWTQDMSILPNLVYSSRLGYTPFSLEDHEEDEDDGLPMDRNPPFHPRASAVYPFYNLYPINPVYSPIVVVDIDVDLEPAPANILDGQDESDSRFCSGSRPHLETAPSASSTSRPHAPARGDNPRH